MPDFINIFLKEKMFLFVGIVQKNERKDTYVIKIKKDNEYFLLKTYTKKSPIDIIEKFKKERNFYLSNKNCQFIPKMIFWKENILIFEYFESTTFRDELFNNGKDNLALVSTLIESLDSFLSYVSKKYKREGTSNFDNVYRYIATLTNSHPMQAKDMEVGILDRILNKIISKLLITQASYTLKYFKCINLTYGFSHMDFHYNNILVNKNLEIRFIDFENIKYEGYFEFDILYLLVIVEVYIEDQKSKEILQEYINRFTFKNEVVSYILNVFRKSISINEKFYLHSQKKSVSRFKKIILILQLIIKVKNV